MNGYTKLFNSIVTSSIWTEDDKTRIVWVTILALADQHGEVHAAVPGLARIASVPLEDCQRAIEKFLAPDPHSRTPDCDGRRIEKIDGGWAIINYAKYRRMASDIDRREKAAERKRRQRDRHATSRTVTPSHAESHDVTLSHANSVTCHAPVTLFCDMSRTSHADVTPELPKAEAEADAEAKEQYIAPAGALFADFEEEPAVVKPARKRNALLDALVSVDGTDPAKATSTLFGQAAKALKEIKEVSPEVTEFEIATRAANYKRLMPTAEISSTALSKHWARCESVAVGGNKTPGIPNI